MLFLLLSGSETGFPATRTQNAQTADVRGPEPRPAVELPIWRLNASLNRRWPTGLVASLRYADATSRWLGISLVFCRDRRLPGRIRQFPSGGRWTRMLAIFRRANYSAQIVPDW